MSLSVTSPQVFVANFWVVARVIQEELLKDLANRSEMSDWFTREDAPKTAAPLVTRPNPKNIQNAAKIEELEQQIKRYASKSTEGFDLMIDGIRVPGCKRNDSLWRYSSDRRRHTTFLNIPIRTPHLQPTHLSSHLPILTYSTFYRQHRLLRK